MAEDRPRVDILYLVLLLCREYHVPVHLPRNFALVDIVRQFVEVDLIRTLSGEQVRSSQLATFLFALSSLTQTSGKRVDYLQELGKIDSILAVQLVAELLQIHP